MVNPSYPYRGVIRERGMYLEHLPWNEICADVVEQFGLPGDRYVTNVGGFYMQFYFRTEQDLLLFKLKWSEYEL